MGELGDAMSLIFTATPFGETTLTFGAIGHTNARQALDFDAGAAHQDQKRFHAPGVAGQFLIRGASTARRIIVAVRYWATTIDAVETLYQADMATMATKSVQFVCMGQTYKGCNLLPDSARRSMRMRPTGRSPAAFVCDVSMVFTQDNPAGL